MMDPILPELRESLAHLMPGFPVIPIISTVENAGDAPQFDADHWVANLRNPVRFRDAIAAAWRKLFTAPSSRSAPTSVLTKAIADTLADPETGNSHHHSIGTLERDKAMTPSRSTPRSTRRSRHGHRSVPTHLSRIPHCRRRRGSTAGTGWSSPARPRRAPRRTACRTAQPGTGGLAVRTHLAAPAAPGGSAC